MKRLELRMNELKQEHDALQLELNRMCIRDGVLYPSKMNTPEYLEKEGIADRVFGEFLQLNLKHAKQK